jgi:hypothetical protein
MTYENELAKMAKEDRTIDFEVKNYLNEFTTYIKQIDVSQMSENPQSKPVKHKIPFKMRIKRIWEKINNTLN